MSIIAALIGLIVVILWLYLSFLELQRSEPAVEKRVITNAFMIKSGFIFCGICAYGMFAFLFIASIYWLLIFKGQTVVYAFLPDAANTFTTVFYRILVTATVLLAFNLAYRMWVQMQYDMFFIDWEKSRGKTVDQYGNEKQAPISVWRTLFAANEWCELQVLKTVIRICSTNPPVFRTIARHHSCGSCFCWLFSCLALA